MEMCLGQPSVQQRLVKAGLQRRLSFSAQIAVSRVEIIEARVQKCVDHFRRLCQIDPAVLYRKAHEAEAEVLFDMFHIGAPSFMFCLYFNGREGFHQAPFSGTQNGSPGHGAAVCCYITGFVSKLRQSIWTDGC